MRGVDEPFGGLQLVVCGDFFQLPPIPSRQSGRGGGYYGRRGGGGGGGRWGTIPSSTSASSFSYYGTYGGSSEVNRTFAFQSEAWGEKGLATHSLAEIIRQRGDPGFVPMLNEIREGILSPETVATLQECHVKSKELPSDGILPTKLYCTNKKVNKENEARLALLSGETRSFSSKDTLKNIDAYGSGGENAGDRERVAAALAAADAVVPRNLQLKVGAQVVLLRNLDPRNKLVNGSRGVIEGFRRKRRRRGGEGMMHGGGSSSGDYSSGNNYDYDESDIISSLSSSSSSSSSSSDEERSADGNGNGDFSDLLPVVRFDCGVVRALKPEKFWASVAGGGGVVREQLPLKLAWALTVHRSQGMSLSRVEVDVGNAFDFGQVYVALSRAESRDGLWVSGSMVSHRAVRTHPDVKNFYDGEESLPRPAAAAAAFDEEGGEGGEGRGRRGEEEEQEEGEAQVLYHGSSNSSNADNGERSSRSGTHATDYNADVDVESWEREVEQQWQWQGSS